MRSSIASLTVPPVDPGVQTPHVLQRNRHQPAWLLSPPQRVPGCHPASRGWASLGRPLRVVIGNMVSTADCPGSNPRASSAVYMPPTWESYYHLLCFSFPICDS